MGGYGGDSSQQRQTENCGNDWFWSSKADQERFVPRLTLTTEDPFKNRVWGFWIQPPRDLSGQLCGLSPLSHTWRLQSMVLNENDILWEFNTAFVRVVVLREQLIKNVLFFLFRLRLNLFQIADDKHLFLCWCDVMNTDLSFQSMQRRKKTKHCNSYLTKATSFDILTIPRPFFPSL